MKYFVLASGSKGNATLISDGITHILIDMGLTRKTLIERLLETNIKVEDIQYFLFTHDHQDHIGGHHFFPIEKRYATKGTIEVNVENELVHYQKRQFGTFTITPLPTSHDAYDGIGFLVENHLEKLVYMTDTGYISQANMKYMENAHYYIIESNHNVRMLLQTDRSYQLIQRILGDTGHLSNEDAALYLSKLIGSNTKEIVLAHLSEEANDPQVALQTHLNLYRQKHIDLEPLKIVTARQHGVISGGS